MTVDGYVQQERWVLISYMLMILSLVLGLTWIIAYWVSHQSLSQPQEVWVRSHSLWVIRTCIIFLVLVLLAALVSLPLIWLPLHSLFGMITAGVAAGIGIIAWLWLLFRSVKGFSRFMRGRAVY